jgi:uracil phosphoribosyltransferase
MTVRVVDHPLAQHLLAVLRDESTEPAAFRVASRKLATALVLEATADLPTETFSVATPLEETEGSRLDRPIVLVPILRAGLGLLEGIVDLFPEVRVGYIGLERDEATFKATEYYSKLPRLDDASVFVIDPMLATGGSASAALAAVKRAGAKSVRMVCVVAAPEGVELLEREHPDVDVFTASVDRELNDTAYILPGLGDFGDRLYGTLDG